MKEAKGPAGSESSTTSGTGCLVRLFWIFLGNMVLLGSAKFISQNHGGFVSAADAVFALTVLALVIVRYMDIAKLHGTTATNQPVTMRTWAVYTLALVLASAILWGVAHWIA